MKLKSYIKIFEEVEVDTMANEIVFNTMNGKIAIFKHDVGHGSLILFYHLKWDTHISIPQLVVLDLIRALRQFLKLKRGGAVAASTIITRIPISFILTPDVFTIEVRDRLSPKNGVVNYDINKKTAEELLPILDYWLERGVLKDIVI